MGVVYRARQRSANRIVALKLIRPERLADLEPEKRQQWLDRFQAEAQATARLEHEHIVTVYEVGSIDGVPFYSMRHVEGRTLAEIVHDGPLENRRAAAVLEPVARAVDHAHRAGILHRDLKPRNILVDTGERPFVMDFGLAKWLGETTHGVTQTGQVFGTPEYMSPEQARDSSRVTAASDVYSLGATLYDLLTGRPPFRAASFAQTLRQVMDEEPVAPRQLNPVIDRDLETITLKCLSKVSSRRYASAAALADDLARYLRHEPIHARPLSAPARFLRWSRRHPGAASALAAILLAALTLTGSVAVVSGKNKDLGRINQSLVDKNLELEASIKRETTATNIANENAAVAREQSQLALKSLEFVLIEVQRKLENVPGAGKLRRSLLQTAIARLQDVSDQFASRGAIDRNTAFALMDLGDVLLRFGSGTPRSPNADGPVPAARMVYQRAFEINEKLAADDPSNARAQHELSVSYLKLGDVKCQSGQVDEALADYQRCLEIRQQLAAADPSDARAQRGLSISYNKLGDVQRQSGQVTEARGSYQKLLEISQKLAAADPSDAQAQRDLSVTYVKLGNVQLESMHMTEARGSYQQGLEISQKLAAADPSDARAQRDLALTHNKLGEVQHKTGQVTEALASFKKGQEIHQKLAADDPSDAQAQRDLAVSLEAVGNAHLDSRQKTEALGAYQNGLEILQKLAAADPSDTGAQRDLSRSYNKHGNVHQQSGHATEAFAFYQQGLEIIQKLAEDNPTDGQAQVDLAATYGAFAHLQQQVKQYEQAIESYGRGLKVLQAMKDQGRLPSANERWIGIIEQSIQRCKHATMALGDWKTLLEQPADLLPVLLDLRGTELVKEGRTAEAVQAVAKLRELKTGTAGQLYNAACVYSLAAASVAKDKPELLADERALRDGYADEAVATLREAVAAGWKDFAHIKKDSDLDAIRQHPGYKAIVDQDQ